MSLAVAPRSRSHSRHSHRRGASPAFADPQATCVRAGCRHRESWHEWPTDTATIPPPGSGLRPVMIQPWPLNTYRGACKAAGCGCPGVLRQGTREALDEHHHHHQSDSPQAETAPAPPEPHSWASNPPPPARRDRVFAWDTDAKAALPGAPDQTHLPSDGETTL